LLRQHKIQEHQWGLEIDVQCHGRRRTECVFLV